MIIKVMYGVLG